MRGHRTYSPYGYALKIQEAVGFNGAHLDALTGHYALGNGYRSYDPVLMRFLSADSVSPFAHGGLNAYAYCLGDPVNQQDPSGHGVWDGLLMLVFGRLLGRKPMASIEPTYTRAFGFHATDGWNVPSLLSGLNAGHSRAGRQSLGEGTYFGSTLEKVLPYQRQAIDGVILKGMLRDDVSLVPNVGYKADPNGVILITPAAYDVIKMVQEVPAGATYVSLPPTGIFARKKTTQRSTSLGAEAPIDAKDRIRETRTWQ